MLGAAGADLSGIVWLRWWVFVNALHPLRKKQGMTHIAVWEKTEATEDRPGLELMT